MPGAGTIEGFASALPMAVGIALSPVPVLAVIVMLMTERALTNASAFLVGWLAGLAGIVVIVSLAPGVETLHGEPTVLSGWIRVLFGAVLLELARRQWRNRPHPEAPVETPKIIAGLEQTGPGKAAGAALLLSGLSIKNGVLAAAGAAAIDASGAQTAGVQAGALTLFVLISSSTLIVPVLAYLISAERFGTVLGAWKNWLVRNNQTVLLVLLILFGFLLISGGMRIVVG